MRIELASGGDCALTDDVRAVVLAAREAMANAAKFSGAEEISVYAEADEDARQRLRPRSRRGLRPRGRAADRHGLSESIEGRMARAGGSATILSTPGEGTEVELTLPLAPVRSEA